MSLTKSILPLGLFLLLANPAAATPAKGRVEIVKQAKMQFFKQPHRLMLPQQKALASQAEVALSALEKGNYRREILRPKGQTTTRYYDGWKQVGMVTARRGPSYVTLEIQRGQTEHVLHQVSPKSPLRALGSAFMSVMLDSSAGNLHQEYVGNRRGRIKARCAENYVTVAGTELTFSADGALRAEKNLAAR